MGYSHRMRRTSVYPADEQVRSRLSWAYGMPVPLVAPGEAWTFETTMRLVERLAAEPIVLVAWCIGIAGAKRRAEQVRKQIDRERYVVRVEDSTRVLAYTREYLLAQVEAESRKHYPDRYWCTLADAAQVLDTTAMHTRELVRNHDVERAMLGDGSLRYLRADVERLAQRRAESKRRARVAAATRRKTTR